MRLNNRSHAQQMDLWPLKETVEGLAGVGVVIQSSCSSFPVGQVVEAAFGWPWKTVFSANHCEPSLRLSLKPVGLGSYFTGCVFAKM